MELMERFETATDGGPEHRPIESRLSDGRRAVRRRRVTVGAALLAALAIVGTGWVLVPGDSVRGAEVTGSPADDSPINVLSDEEAGNKPGEVEEICRYKNPTNSSSTYRQTQGTDPGELDLTDCVTVRFVGSKDAAGRPLVHPDAPFVGFANGALVAAPGVTIVDSTRNPDVKGYTRSGEQTAAVTITYAGETWFVLTSDGTLGHSLAQKSAEVPTMAAFLARQEQPG